MCFCRELWRAGWGCSRSPALRCRICSYWSIFSWPPALSGEGADSGTVPAASWVGLAGQHFERPSVLSSSTWGCSVTLTLPSQVRHQNGYHGSSDAYAYTLLNFFKCFFFFFKFFCWRNILKYLGHWRRITGSTSSPTPQTPWKLPELLWNPSWKLKISTFLPPSLSSSLSSSLSFFLPFPSIFWQHSL